MRITYPAYVYWEVTSACNHKCVHCYNYWRDDIDTSMVFEYNCKQADRIADKIIELKPAHVVITGGEPMLHFHDVFPLLKMMVSNGIVVSINTNATLITEEIAELMKEIGIGCLVSLPCSDKSICDFICQGNCIFLFWKRKK